MSSANAACLEIDGSLAIRPRACRMDGEHIGRLVVTGALKAHWSNPGQGLGIRVDILGSHAHADLVPSLCAHFAAKSS